MKITSFRPVILAFCSIFGFCPFVSAQESETWKGTVAISDEIETKIEVAFTKSFGASTATIKMPELSPLALPLTNVEFENHRVYFELTVGPNDAKYDGERISDELIKGDFTQKSPAIQGTSQGVFVLELTDRTVDLGQLIEEPVELVTESGTLRGTLLTPNVFEPPVALLISRPTLSDRDGNLSSGPGMPMVQLNTLKLLAIGLSNQGIATVRFDKRGIGESRIEGFDESDLRFVTYANDVSGWLNQLKQDTRFAEVFVIGHQEGALLASLAALEVPVSGVVSLAGAGIPANEIILEQVANQPSLFPELAVDLDQLESTLTAVKRGEDLPDLPPNLRTAFRESIRGYLRSWFEYDPRQIAAKLDVPFLVVQGTTDMRVAEGNGRKLADANPHATLVEIQQMNHLLRQTDEAMSVETMVITHPEAPLHEALIPTVAKFIDTTGE